MAQSGDLTLPQPQYDLEAVRSSVDLAKVPEAKWGDGETARTIGVAGTASALAPSPGAAVDPAGFRHARAIQPVLESGDKTIGLLALPLDAHALAHSRGPTSRFADVRVLDSPTSRFPTCSSAATSHSRLMSRSCRLLTRGRRS